MQTKTTDRAAIHRNRNWIIYLGSGVAGFVMVLATALSYVALAPPTFSVPGETVKGWGCMAINDEFSASVYYNMIFSNDGKEILLNYFGHEEKLTFIGSDGFGEIWKGPRFTYRNDHEEYLIDRPSLVRITPGCMTVREGE